VPLCVVHLVECLGLNFDLPVVVERPVREHESLVPDEDFCWIDAVELLNGDAILIHDIKSLG